MIHELRRAQSCVKKGHNVAGSLSLSFGRMYSVRTNFVILGKICESFEII